MELKINLDITPENGKMGAGLGIASERALSLIKQAAEATATFASRAHPLVSMIVDTIGEEGTEQQKEELKEAFGGKDPKYFRNPLNLYKEIAAMCDNLEEYTLVLPMVERVMKEGIAEKKVTDSMLEQILN